MSIGDIMEKPKPKKASAKAFSTIKKSEFRKTPPSMYEIGKGMVAPEAMKKVVDAGSKRASSILSKVGSAIKSADSATGKAFDRGVKAFKDFTENDPTGKILKGSYDAIPSMAKSTGAASDAVAKAIGKKSNDKEKSLAKGNVGMLPKKASPAPKKSSEQGSKFISFMKSVPKRIVDGIGNTLDENADLRVGKDLNDYYDTRRSDLEKKSQTKKLNKEEQQFLDNEYARDERIKKRGK